MHGEPQAEEEEPVWTRVKSTAIIDPETRQGWIWCFPISVAGVIMLLVRLWTRGAVSSMGYEQGRDGESIIIATPFDAVEKSPLPPCHYPLRR
jgi:hypothetical protein